MKKPLGNINPNIFNIPKMDIPEPNWELINESLSNVNLEDVFNELKEQNSQLRENNDKLVNTLTEQHTENTKLSSSNSRLTLLTIIITIVLGVPNIFSLFSENYNQKILSEQIEQNKLLKKHTELLDSMLIESISLREQLLTKKTTDEKN
ncbi:hypothetical protein [Algibacter sp. L1A34]|uniref:hypothetical protein n=1 Tax=Algibacter sp. L1A34 TaxID=2686365 RepID=UPI00131E3624|nr:hypothetical protein [Algibacter sp. L1A34]